MVPSEQSYPGMVILGYIVRKDSVLQTCRICTSETGIIFDERTDVQTDKHWENIIFGLRNLCSKSCIPSEMCLVTNTATKNTAALFVRIRLTELLYSKEALFGTPRRQF